MFALAPPSFPRDWKTFTHRDTCTETHWRDQEISGQRPVQIFPEKERTGMTVSVEPGGPLSPETQSLGGICHLHTFWKDPVQLFNHRSKNWAEPKPSRYPSLR